MRYGLLSALLLSLLVLPVAAQTVEITLVGGGTVRGELQGFENGKYKVLVNGTLESIAEKDVLTVNLVGEYKPPRKIGGIEEIQEVIDAGRYEEALQAIEALLISLESKHQELRAMLLRVHKDALAVRIARQDAKGIVEQLKKVMPSLNSVDQQAYVAFLAEKLTAQIHSEPSSEFAITFADLLSKTMADPKAWSEEDRHGFAGVIQTLGEKAEQQKFNRAAAGIYRAAVRLEPSRGETLNPKRIELLLSVAKARLDSNDFPAAIAAADEVLTLSASAKASEIREEALYSGLRRDMELALGSEYRTILEVYLKTAKKPEYRKWAEEKLSQTKPPTGEEVKISAEIRRYYPVTIGSWYKYATGDKDTFKKIHVDSASVDEGVVKIFNTLEDIYKSYVSSKIFQVEIDSTSVALSSGQEREILLRFPLKVDDRWDWKSKKEAFSRRVVSINETLSLREVTYSNCVVIEFTSRTLQPDGPTVITSRSYYAPHVGLVKLEFLEAGYQSHNLELVEKGLD